MGEGKERDRRTIWETCKVKLSQNCKSRSFPRCGSPTLQRIVEEDGRHTCGEGKKIGTARWRILSWKIFGGGAPCRRKYPKFQRPYCCLRSASIQVWQVCKFSRPYCCLRSARWTEYSTEGETRIPVAGETRLSQPVWTRAQPHCTYARPGRSVTV